MRINETLPPWAKIIESLQVNEQRWHVASPRD
jgi:hypothetical protein